MYTKCQVFTPNNYVHELLDSVSYAEHLYGLKLLENSCGDGNILKEVVRRYIIDAIKQGYSKRQIVTGLESDIYGYEIDKKHYNKCIDNLNQIAMQFDLPNIRWSIFNQDYLFSNVEIKYDYIIGNPPYLNYSEIDKSNRFNLKEKFETCRLGKFDYCYAFIEKSLTELNERGKFSYLVPGSIFKTVFGKALRDKIKCNLVAIKDYKCLDIFNGALVKSVIIILDNSYNKEVINYIDISNKIQFDIEKKSLQEKWIFSKYKSISTKRFGDYFKVSNTIATLYNKAFVIKNIDLEKYKYVINNIKLEESLIKPAYSPKSLRYGKREFIIFPYLIKRGKIIRMTEIEFQERFPGIRNYLTLYEDKLLSRDRDKSCKWFEYGRSQALGLVNKEKLLISTIITNTVLVYSLKRQDIPYSGLIITKLSNSGLSLSIAKKILQSRDFLNYVRSIGVPLNGNSVRITSKDIENFTFREI